MPYNHPQISFCLTPEWTLSSFFFFFSIQWKFMIKDVIENSKSSHPEIFEKVIALKGFEI